MSVALKPSGRPATLADRVPLKVTRCHVMRGTTPGQWQLLTINKKAWKHTTGGEGRAVGKHNSGEWSADVQHGGSLRYVTSSIISSVNRRYRRFL